MKRSRELLGLPVISIEDGKELGRVSDYAINPSIGSVEYLIIDEGVKYLGIKILPFTLIEGVGEYAVTVRNSLSMTGIGDEPQIRSLLEKDVQVNGAVVLTGKGKLIGTVTEFLVDEEAQGKIAGCEIAAGGDSLKTEIIYADKIVTFGKDLLIVNDGTENTLTNTLPVSTGITGASAAPEFDPVTEAIENDEPSQAARLFEQRQCEYLLGRKASKRIENDNGELIAEEGQVITGELLEKAKQTGKFTELSMNTRS